MRPPFSQRKLYGSAVVLDMSAAALPVQLSASRSGSVVFAQRSDTTCVGVSGGLGIYEIKDGFGGWWTFPAYTNTIAGPLSIGDANWLQQGNVFVTRNDAAAPDGTVTATRVLSTGGNPQAAVYQSQGLVGPGEGSVWAASKPGDPPVPSGSVEWPSGGKIGANFSGSSGAYRRYSFTSISPSFYVLRPVGYDVITDTITSAGTGSMLMWGAQTISDCAMDLPLCSGSTDACTIQFSASYAPTVVSGGDFDVEGRFMSEHHYFYTSVDTTHFFGMFSMTASDGRTSLVYTGSSDTWEAKFPDGTVLRAKMRFPAYHTEVSWRMFYRPSTNRCGLMILAGNSLQAASTTNGGTGYSAYVSGSASHSMVAPTQVHIGSEFGANVLPARWTRFSILNRQSPSFTPEGMVLGDSITGYTTDSSLEPVLFPAQIIYSASGSRNHNGIVSHARSGDKAADQEAAYNASPFAGSTWLRWVLIQVGVNNIGSGAHTAAQTINYLQGLVNAVKTKTPWAKVIISQIPPCRAYLNTLPESGSNYTVWQNVNTAIAGGGATPITGTDYKVTGHVAAMGNGSDYLKSTMVGPPGDQLHPNDIGKQTFVDYWRAGLQSLGFVP